MFGTKSTSNSSNGHKRTAQKVGNENLELKIPQLVTICGTNYGKIINEVMVLPRVRFLNEATGLIGDIAILANAASIVAFDRSYHDAGRTKINWNS